MTRLTAYCILGGAATQFPRGCGVWVELPERRKPQGIHPDGTPGVGLQSNLSVPQPRFCFAVLIFALLCKLHLKVSGFPEPIQTSTGHQLGSSPLSTVRGSLEDFCWPEPARTHPSLDSLLPKTCPWPLPTNPSSSWSSLATCTPDSQLFSSAGHLLS